jgi:hypothetical protein
MGSGLVLACGDCAGPHPPPESPPLVFVLIAVLTVIAGLILFLQRRRRRRPRRVTDRWSAHAVMGELCPHGWQAQITIRGSGAPPPPDAPPGRTPPVAVEWKLYEARSDEVAVSRRIWADTVEQALQGMVDDRRLDLALEQIEQKSLRAEDQG